MSAIDNIKDHFNSLDQGESKFVEEWNLTIYKQPIKQPMKIIGKITKNKNITFS